MENRTLQDDRQARATGKNAEFARLVETGVLDQSRLNAAAAAAQARGIELERVLLRDLRVPKRAMLEALADHYQCPSFEYDERLPIPPELVSGLSADALSTFQWVPVMQDRSGAIVIAARNPTNSSMREDVERQLPATRYEFRVALDDDIQWCIQDFLHARPGLLIGTERTGLAFWRNTMAQWRTRMACYRTDLAKARTSLAFIRWGLGTVALANVLLRSRSAALPVGLAVLVLGAGIALWGLPTYLRVRRSRMTPPGNQTIVEVTAATIQFLDEYHVLPSGIARREMQGTMLARMGDLLAEYSTYLPPTPSSKTRTMFARERNVLAAQRTIAACYRTVYARARTGLAFVRTGISFLSIGIGLLSYYGFGPLAAGNLLLVAAGLLMAGDGVQWYWPVRKEQAEIPRGVAYPE